MAEQNAGWAEEIKTYPGTITFMDGLDVLRELGKGAYSVVHLVRRKRVHAAGGGGAGSRQLGALKTIPQSLVRTPKRAAHVFSERAAPFDSDSSVGMRGQTVLGGWVVGPA